MNERSARGRPAPALAGLLILSLLAACGESGAVVGTELAGLARQLGRSGDDTALLVRRSGVDVGVWVSSLVRAKEKYAQLPEGVRSLTCSTLTGIAGDVAKRAVSTTADEPLDAAHRLTALAESLAAFNKTQAVAQLQRDLTSAGRDLASGKPVTLIVLSLQSGVCGV